MIEPASNIIITAGTGDSSTIVLGPGEHLLIFEWASSAGTAALKIGDGDTFVDATNDEGAISITSNISYLVPGGCAYKVNVSVHSSVLTITPLKV